MNIFVLHDDPILAANDQVDKHVVKMALETAQILSTCHRVLESPNKEEVYKTTHVNHPCCVWARESKENYNWLYEHFIGLLEEYTYRYEKIHGCTKLVDILRNNPVEVSKGRTRFALAMPDDYKVEDCVQSYRNYYNNDKRDIFSWKKRGVPKWIET